MTQAEAKMRILAEWRTWVGHRQVIEQNHPDLLSFESSDDKRQLVKRCLVDAGLIKG